MTTSTRLTLTALAITVTVASPDEPLRDRLVVGCVVESETEAD